MNGPVLVKPAHFFSALNASTTTMYLWASLSITYTVYFSTLSIDFYHGSSFLCPSLPFFGLTFESLTSGLESWLEQYDRKMQPHHFLRGNFVIKSPFLDHLVIWNSVDLLSLLKIRIVWLLWCIKVQICKQFYCEFMHSCLLFTNLNFAPNLP